MRQAVRGEKHHWWPRSLSRYWANDEGLLHRIDTNGLDICSRPEQFGQISNGHKFTEQFRGEIEKRENMGLIAANINQSYSALVSSSRGCGKLAIISSDNFEFIYGDGVYSNIGATTESLSGLKLAIPVTLKIAVVWSLPMSYRIEPRIKVVHADTDIVRLINYSIQVYSKDYLFYRSQKPELLSVFKEHVHKVFKSDHDPIANLINQYQMKAKDTQGFTYKSHNKRH
jgi:hypothetical protein